MEEANKQSSTDDNGTTINGRPLQRISWSEKTKDEYEWFGRNARYYISISILPISGNMSNSNRDVRQLYEVYNSKFPSKWFNHLTDPLSAKNPQHKKFPAKIRPVTILRTNIDLLLGEYPKRPFVYQVTNSGDDGYNSFTEGLRKAVQDNLSKHFAAGIQQEMQQQGVPQDKIPGLDEIELPEEMKERFSSSYKDAIAIQGQRWMKRAMKEYHIREEFNRMLKDWLIAGTSVSYKGISHGSLKYKRKSPLQFDFDKSPEVEFAEDGEWQIYTELLTISDIVDEFYEELTESDLKMMERHTQYQSPMTFFGWMQDNFAHYAGTGKIPVYHIVWKGKKKLGILSYLDPLTGKELTMEVDEDYVVNKDGGETVEWKWVTVPYQVWQVGDTAERIYLRAGEVPVPRNAINNLSTCKLPYNARNYSDMHSANISVLEMGLPFQILYIIVNYVLERTIAKNKGKIMMIDKNSIPSGQGWNDEKFLYYAEALGYMLVDRNKQGVDKNWQQHQVMDMSLFDQIEQLIKLKESIAQDWDNVLGITRPRKGEMMASDGKATSEMGLMQSSVITDMIFTLFEEFTERELQGILDHSKAVNIDGVKGVYNTDDFDMELLNIDPNTYAYAELGVLMSRSTDEMATLNAIKNSANVPAMYQAGVKASTIAEIQRSQNVAELIMKLKKIEDIEAQMEQQVEQSKEEAQKQADDRKKEYARFENMLKGQLLDKEWDRRDENEMIKGQWNELSYAKTQDADGNGIPDAVEVEKLALEREKMKTTTNTKQQEMMNKDMMNQRDNETKRKDIEAKVKVARLRPKPSK